MFFVDLVDGHAGIEVSFHGVGQFFVTFELAEFDDDRRIFFRAFSFDLAQLLRHAAQSHAQRATQIVAFSVGSPYFVDDDPAAQQVA